MRFLFSADHHMHNHSQFATRTASGLNSRLEDCLDIFRQMREAVKTYEIDHVFILGDLFESRTKLDIDVLDQTFKAVRDLASDVSRYVWLLKGNHDENTRVGDIHSLEAFREIDNVEVIAKPWVCLPVPMAHIAAFPHTTDTEALKQQLADISRVDLILLHQSIREGKIGPYGKTIAGEICLADLPMDRCRYVLAGDYHARQFLGPENRVHYVGSPLQLKAAEAGEEKGFTYLDTDDWKLCTIPTTSPKFHVFPTPRQAKEAIEAGEVDPGRDFLRVEHVEQEQQEADELKKSFERIQLDEQSEQRSLARTSAAVTESDYDLCLEYVQQRGGEFPEAELVGVAMELLGEE